MEEAKQSIAEAIRPVLDSYGISHPAIEFDVPDAPEHGDIATNAALVYAKEAGKNPRELGEEIADSVRPAEGVTRVEVAGPGFVNIFLAPGVFRADIEKLLSGNARGKEVLSGKRMLIEYTDPNPFKVFHIGHLMSNTIGESVSRLSEYAGAKVFRLCYQGDVGMHVAKAVWGMMQDPGNFPAEGDSLEAKAEFLGNAYAFGATQFEEDEDVGRAIRRINVEIYEKSNEEVLNLYDFGRRSSLEYFDTIYERLGTRFDRFFFESDMAKPARALVKRGLENGVFQESDGAVVYPGEDKGLHTRVFLNSEGLPTYEAKDLALAHAKDEEFEGNYDTSIVITAEEQKQYFRVVLAALEDIAPALAKKTEHMTHGIMKLSTGKMSSRRGGVTSAEDMVAIVSEAVEEKMEGRIEGEGRAAIAEAIAIGAIKFWILRQSAGKDIVFDIQEAVSLEGDSGPYVQYTAVRAQSVLNRAEEEGIEPSLERAPDEAHDLEKSLVRFEEAVTRAVLERAPHHVSHALLELASAFNRFYGEATIVDLSDPLAPYRAALTLSVRKELERGLYLLGIRVPEKM